MYCYGTDVAMRRHGNGTPVRMEELDEIFAKNSKIQEKPKQLV